MKRVSLIRQMALHHNAHIMGRHEMFPNEIVSETTQATRPPREKHKKKLQRKARMKTRKRGA